MDHPIDAKSGKASMFSKDPKRIIYWISKAWTPFEKLLQENFLFGFFLIGR
jgi:hypothetical protein